MSYKYSKQLDVYDSASEILSISGVSGQHAYAEDTKTIYIHNGLTWITGYSLGKIIGSGSMPTVSPGLLAGSGATISFTPNSTNLIGTIQLKTGTTVNTSGTLFTVTLADAASYPTSTVPIITPANTDAMGFLKSYNVTSSTTGFSIQCSGVSVGVNTMLIFNYFNPGY